MIQRESCVFYKSYREVIETLPKDEQLRAWKYIACYALDGEEPNEKETVAYGVFAMAKQFIEPRRKRGAKK